MSDAIAAEVRALMGRRRTTQTALASQINTSQPALSRRITGEIPFDVEQLATIVDVLGDDLASLVGRAVTQNLKNLTGIDRHLRVVSDIEGQMSIDELIVDPVPPPILCIVPDLGTE